MVRRMLMAAMVVFGAMTAFAAPPIQITCGPGDDAEACVKQRAEVARATFRKMGVDRAKKYMLSRARDRKFRELVAGIDLPTWDDTDKEWKDGDGAADDLDPANAEDWDLDTLIGVLWGLEDEKLLDDTVALKPSQVRPASAAKKSLKSVLKKQRALATDPDKKMDYVGVALGRLGGMQAGTIVITRSQNRPAKTAKATGAGYDALAGKCHTKCGGNLTCAEACLDGK